MDSKEKILLFEDPGEVIHVLRLMRNLELTIPPTETKIHEMIEFTRLRCFSSHSFSTALKGQREWEEWFLTHGNCVLWFLSDEFNEDEFIDLLTKKHHAYTATPLLKWMQLGILFRMSSKSSRFQSLDHLRADDFEKYQALVLEETQKDTMMDMLGYDVLGYLLTNMHGVKPKL